MGSLVPRSKEPIKPGQTLILRYVGEDDQSFFVTALDGTYMNIPKNRSIPQQFSDQSSKPLSPAFRLLAWAFVGLAPAGLGTLILAPLAALWALILLITRPLSKSDLKRVLIIFGIAITLLGIAIPTSRFFLALLFP